MITSMRFGARWSDYRQKFNDTFSEAKARRRHALRKRYTALIETDDGTLAALELCFIGAYCIVSFLDDQGRCDQTHSYIPVEDGRLFLSAISKREFEGQSRWSKGGYAWSFTPEGRMQILSSDDQRGLVVLAENLPVDVSTHFEPIPAFGAWEPLLHRERGQQPVPVPQSRS